MSSAWIIRALAAISVLLAAICLALAWQANTARHQASCWRAVAEEGVAAEGDCRKLS